MASPSGEAVCDSRLMRGVYQKHLAHREAVPPLLKERGKLGRGAVLSPQGEGNDRTRAVPPLLKERVIKEQERLPLLKERGKKAEVDDFFVKKRYNKNMYGVYGDLIRAAERALEEINESGELLEYPEVQADKAYYLSVLSKYNSLLSVREKLSALKDALASERELFSLLAEANTEEERGEIYSEISALKRGISGISRALSVALGFGGVTERAYCRLKFGKLSAGLGVALYALIKSHLTSRGAKIESEVFSYTREKSPREVSFIAEGEDTVARLSLLSGAHKVSVAGAKSEELCFAVTTAAQVEKVDENDLRLDLFHSDGAGGQNVNKVETAVRVTHIPTGISVVCRDERSQLKNKKRALENMERRLGELNAAAEKARVEGDIAAQYLKKHAPPSFDVTDSTMTDGRLSSFVKVSFPLTDEQFTNYLNGLTTL